jgi:hypothetical protein
VATEKLLEGVAVAVHRETKPLGVRQELLCLRFGCCWPDSDVVLREGCPAL